MGGKGKLCMSRMSKARWKPRKLGQNHTVSHLKEDAGKPNRQGTVTVPARVRSQPWHGGKVAITGVQELQLSLAHNFRFQEV